MPDQIVRSERQLAAIMRRNRKQQGYTQQSLAEQTGLRQGTISRLELGEPAMQLRTLMAVLAAMNLELVVRPRTNTKPDDIEALF